ncbi:hypothetical protein DFR72_1091, partial [Lentzea flaviverrucosa]
MSSPTRACRRVAGVAAIAVVASVLVPVSAHAEEDSDDHAAGSQIAKHEGTGEMLTTPPDLGAGNVGRVDGIDVSSHQGNVDWGHWWRS